MSDEWRVTSAGGNSVRKANTQTRRGWTHLGGVLSNVGILRSWSRRVEFVGRSKAEQETVSRSYAIYLRYLLHIPKQRNISETLKYTAKAAVYTNDKETYIEPNWANFKKSVNKGLPHIR